MKVKKPRKAGKGAPKERLPLDILTSALSHLTLRVKMGTITSKDLFYAARELKAAEMRLSQVAPSSMLKANEIASMKKFAAHLDRGENPFSFKDNLTEVGTAVVPLPEPLPVISEEEKQDVINKRLAEASAYWRSGASVTPYRRRWKGDNCKGLIDLDIPCSTPTTLPAPEDLDYLQCHFCERKLHKLWDATKITIGKVPKFIRTEEKIGDTIISKVRVSQDLVVACPAHALKVKTTSEGMTPTLQVFLSQE